MPPLPPSPPSPPQPAFPPFPPSPPNPGPCLQTGLGTPIHDSSVPGTLDAPACPLPANCPLPPFPPFPPCCPLRSMFRSPSICLTQISTSGAWTPLTPLTPLPPPAPCPPSVALGKDPNFNASSIGSKLGEANSGNGRGP